MTPRRRLRSSASHRLEGSPVRLSTVGKRAFPVASANMWNDLPFHITSVQSLAVFGQRLKTFLVSHSYPDILIWLNYHYWLLSLFFLLFSGISRGPSNNWHYLCHVKHVHDDDDDDEWGTFCCITTTSRSAQRCALCTNNDSPIITSKVAK